MTDHSSRACRSCATNFSNAAFSAAIRRLYLAVHERPDAFRGRARPLAREIEKARVTVQSAGGVYHDI
jgi:hypothetical protein